MACTTRRAFGTPAVGQGRTVPVIDGLDSSTSCERGSVSRPELPGGVPDIENPHTDLWQDEISIEFMTEDTGAFVVLL